MPRIGLDKLHFAKINADGSYAVPVPIPEIIEATITPNIVTANLSADDKIVETASSLSDVDVEINISDLSTASYELLMGVTKNADGVVIDKTSDQAPYGAIGFRSRKSNGSYRHVWLYKGKFGLPEEAYKTKGEEIEFQTQTITAKFIPDSEDKVRARVDSDDQGIGATVIANWFTSVYEGPTV
jgi:phi13 family phage major tail protein